MLLLKLTNLEVKFGTSLIINNISMNVSDGELIVLLGSNGAGKSTIFNTISGFHKPTKGTITFLDKKISRLSPDKIVKAGIVQCAEGRKLFHDMTVEENLKLGAFIY